MEFNTLYEFMVATKTCTYGLMGLTLLGLFGFYRFLTGRDKVSGRPLNWKHGDKI